MANQPKETDRGVRPFGFDDRILERSGDLDHRVHPKGQPRGRLGEHAAERSVRPFSAGNLALAKAGSLDHRARPHGDNDGVSLQHGKSIQPFSAGEMTSEKGVDRRARPEHQQSKR